MPRLDRADLNLLALGQLTPEQQVNYKSLSAQLTKVLASQPACPGDGNIDGAVNGLDKGDWLAYQTLAQGASSWYDINMDGLTNTADLALIQQYMGKCPN